MHLENMPKRVKIVLAVVFVALVGVIVGHVMFREPQPVGSGKPLSEWLRLDGGAPSRAPNRLAQGPTTEIFDVTGQHRLIVRYAPFGSGANFDALIWRTQEAGIWKQQLVISANDFQKGCPRRRWVKEAHSFAPATGI